MSSPSSVALTRRRLRDAAHRAYRADFYVAVLTGESYPLAYLDLSVKASRLDDLDVAMVSVGIAFRAVHEALAPAGCVQ